MHWVTRVISLLSLSHSLLIETQTAVDYVSYPLTPNRILQHENISNTQYVCLVEIDNYAWQMQTNQCMQPSVMLIAPFHKYRIRSNSFTNVAFTQQMIGVNILNFQMWYFCPIEIPTKWMISVDHTPNRTLGFDDICRKLHGNCCDENSSTA